MAGAASDRSTGGTAGARSGGPAATSIVERCAATAGAATGCGTAATADAATSDGRAGVAVAPVTCSVNPGERRPMPRVLVRFRLRRRAHGETKLPAASRRAPSDRKASAGSAARADRAGAVGVDAEIRTMVSQAAGVKAQTATARTPMPAGKRLLRARSRRLATSRCRRRRSHQGDRRRTLGVRLRHRRPGPRRRSPRRRLRPRRHAATGRHHRPTTRTGKDRSANRKDHGSTTRRTEISVRRCCRSQSRSRGARMRARISISRPSAACSTTSSTRSKPTAPP